jgi:outer membrane protein TolC
VNTAYATDIIPKGERMLTSMREGYTGGLVTLVEVLEAQQALVRLRQEKTQAELEVKLAEVAVMEASMTLPTVGDKS